MATADFVVDGLRLSEEVRDTVDAAEMYLWLCGRHDEFHYLGGQSWPADIIESKPPLGPEGEFRYRRRYGAPGDITDRRGRRT